jgi:Raf kinase inhibitor-like YbhB/YbcL family protein
MNTFILFLMTSFSTSTATLDVSSPSFKNGDYIPTMYTCEGQSTNPPLEIKAIPPGTQTLALIVDDPDAPAGTFDHWVIWNIEPAKTIRENSAPGTEGRNGKGSKGYTGPCPPAGTGIHHYHFKLYALDTKLDLGAGAKKSELENAMKGHVLGQGELVGLYSNTKAPK